MKRIFERDVYLGARRAPIRRLSPFGKKVLIVVLLATVIILLYLFFK